MKTNKNRAICRVPGYFGRTGYVVKNNESDMFQFDFFFDGYNRNDKEGWIPVFKHEFYSFEIHGERPVGMNPSLFAQ